MITKEMEEHDNDRWATVNLLAELKYCGRNIKHRKSITNDDLRFYATLMRYAEKQLTPNPIPVDTKMIGTFSGDVEVFCCFDCRAVLDPTFHYCPHCGAELDWSGQDTTNVMPLGV